jgi:hypothetical protein
MSIFGKANAAQSLQAETQFQLKCRVTKLCKETLLVVGLCCDGLASHCVRRALWLAFEALAELLPPPHPPPKAELRP